MKVRVELQAYLQQYSPNGEGTFELELPEGARVQDLLRQLRIPDEMTSIIVLGNKDADYEDPLTEGDQVTLIPPLAGGSLR